MENDTVQNDIGEAVVKNDEVLFKIFKEKIQSRDCDKQTWVVIDKIFSYMLDKDEELNKSEEGKKRKKTILNSYNNRKDYLLEHHYIYSLFYYHLLNITDDNVKTWSDMNKFAYNKIIEELDEEQQVQPLKKFVEIGDFNELQNNFNTLLKNYQELQEQNNKLQEQNVVLQTQIRTQNDNFVKKEEFTTIIQEQNNNIETKFKELEQQNNKVKEEIKKEIQSYVEQIQQHTEEIQNVEESMYLLQMNTEDYDEKIKKVQEDTKEICKKLGLQI